MNLGTMPPAVSGGTEASAQATWLQSLPSRLDYVILGFAGGRDHHWRSPFFVASNVAEFSPGAHLRTFRKKLGKNHR